MNKGDYEKGALLIFYYLSMFSSNERNNSSGILWFQIPFLIWEELWRCICVSEHLDFNPDNFNASLTEVISSGYISEKKIKNYLKKRVLAIISVW